MVKNKTANRSLIAVTICALLLGGCTTSANDGVAGGDGAAASADSAAVTQATNGGHDGTAEIGSQTVELSAEKPEVAPVAKNNEPNRIAMNLPEDPSTKMSFNWYTTDDVPGSMVRVSTDAGMAEPLEFPAETTEVTSEYAERDKDGFYIYADIATNDDGDFFACRRRYAARSTWLLH